MIGLTVESQKNHVMVARVAGDIDSVTSGELRHGVSRRLTNVVPGLILDLTEATYVDSAGIEFLFDLAERLRSRGQGFDSWSRSRPTCGAFSTSAASRK